MKKASILSFQFADNYGAVLQIYAMSKLLEKEGYTVEVIDFSPEELTMPYDVGINITKLREASSMRDAIKMLLINIYTLKRDMRRKKNFEDFRKDYLNLTTKRYFTSQELDNAKELKKFDIYIVGSDQVWNPAFFEVANSAYFLNFANESSLKIAYAASIAEKIDEENIIMFEENLKNIDAISVRESSAKTEIGMATNKDITVTLDPTLLMKKDFWESLVTESKPLEPFILVYDLVKDERTIKVANTIARELNCKIVSYSFHKGFENWYFTFAGCHPTDFLRLYRDAKFVVTSSFHGTAFSLLFEKDFYTIPHPTRGSRMIDLLNSVSLGERIVYGVEDKISSLDLIDYTEPNIKLSELREKSIKFLNKALKQKDKELE